MSPAGHWPQLRAAVEAGADAVYFGLRHFSARGKVGFGLDELPEAIAALHERGVQGFVTFNTLVFDHELAEAERALVAIAAAGRRRGDRPGRGRGAAGAGRWRRAWPSTAPPRCR
jgi:U32 family peptidase